MTLRVNFCLDGQWLARQKDLQERTRYGPWPADTLPASWRAEQACSARLASNISLLGDRQSVINLDTEIANRALDLGMPEQQLYGPQVARSAIN